MFTNQAQALNVLRGYLPDDAVDAFAFLSQCNETLEHRGPVTIGLTSPSGANDTYAPLTLANYAGGGGRVNGIPQDGTALYIEAGNIVMNGGGITNIGPTNIGGVGVRFWNGSGETVPAYGVMRIVGKVFRPIITRTGPVMVLHVSIAKPNTTFCREYLVNGSAPVAAGGTGTGFAPGLCTALYLPGGSPTLGQEWGPTNGQWYLSANRPGFYVYDAVSATGPTLLANQQRVESIIGVVDSNITSGNNGTISIHFGAAGSEADSTINLTLSRSWIANTATLAANKRCKVTWINGIEYVTQLEC